MKMLIKILRISMILRMTNQENLMFQRGSIVKANTDHFDDEFGDLYIERGDEFEVLEGDSSFSIKLKPIGQEKYQGESYVKSLPEFFEQVSNG